jgi:hypothetical protein
MAKKAAGPDEVSLAYVYMAPIWARASSLLGGTTAMRAAGTEYLPKHPGEEDEAYHNRKLANYLFNMYELTLDALVGRPFSDPTNLHEDTPPQISELQGDINLQGDNLTVFCRSWFREGMSKAFSHVLVDMPALDEEQRENRTLADDKADKRRPYWVHIAPENVLAMYSEVIDGEEVLTHVRIMEVTTERVGFDEVQVRRIKVLERGTFEIFTEMKVGKSNKVEWVSGGQKPTGIDFIPLVTFYANRSGLMEGKPPLDDLAFLNVRHWQSNADQINVTTVARFPMLAASGVTDETGGQLSIGPRQMLGTRDSAGKFYYVEHSGKAIEAGAKDLMAIEEQMAAYGAEFLRRRPGGSTATARALDSAESVSSLQDAIIRFIDSVNTALEYTAKWLGLEEGGSVIIPFDFGPEMADNSDIRSLNEMRRNRDISREGYLEEFKRRGGLSDNFDPNKDLDRLKNEDIIVSPFATGANVSLGDPDDDTNGDGVVNKADSPGEDSKLRGPGKSRKKVKQPGSEVTGEDGNDA